MIDLQYRNYESVAYKFIHKLPLNCWIYFNQIPYNIRGSIINILDAGYKPEIKVFFDETCTKFILTRDIPEQVSLGLKREHKIN